MAFFSRVRSKFLNAFRGLLLAFTTDNSFKVHLFFSAVVIGIGVGLKASAVDWALLAIAIGLVVVAELFNTAIEYLVRMFTTEYHELAGKLLDISAGAVLFASLIALVLAGIVFVPLAITAMRVTP